MENDRVSTLALNEVKNKMSELIRGNTPAKNVTISLHAYLFSFRLSV
jgi:hypothetical protein